MSKERDMRRTDWKRITKRRYVSRGEADIFGSAGRISLTLIDEVTGPLTVHYKSRTVLIADAGYSWFQAAVPGARWWLTAMFDERDRIIQIYFDITGLTIRKTRRLRICTLISSYPPTARSRSLTGMNWTRRCKAARSPYYTTGKQSRPAKSWRSFSVKIRPPSWTGAAPCNES